MLNGIHPPLRSPVLATQHDGASAILNCQSVISPQPLIPEWGWFAQLCSGDSPACAQKRHCPSRPYSFPLCKGLCIVQQYTVAPYAARWPCRSLVVASGLCEAILTILCLSEIFLACHFWPKKELRLWPSISSLLSSQWKLTAQLSEIAFWILPLNHNAAQQYLFSGRLPVIFRPPCCHSSEESQREQVACNWPPEMTFSHECMHLSIKCKV